MSELRLSEVKYSDHSDLGVQGQTQESRPSLRGGLCFPPNACYYILPLCSVLYRLETRPLQGLAHCTEGHQPDSDLARSRSNLRGSSITHQYTVNTQKKRSVSKEHEYCDHIYFILFSPFIRQIPNLCQAQMIVRGQDLILLSASSQPRGQEKAQTHIH